MSKEADNIREYWVDLLTAAVSTVADSERRRKFAETTLAGIGTTYPRGHRKQSAFPDSVAVRKRAEAVVSSVKLLVAEVERDPFRAGQFGLPLSDLRTRAHALIELLDRSIAKTHRVPKPRPGPKNALAVEITAMVAREYELCLGKRPGRGKRGADNPYHRACNVFAELLQAHGYRVKLSDPARAAGLLAARRAIDTQDS